MSLKIIGLGKGIPKRCVSNDELSEFIDTNNEWIVSRTGIKSRHVCTDETLTDLSTAAASQAIQKAGLTTADIDLIICTTIGGDFRTPSLACCVSERIEALCPAFDINAACTGFIYALDVASLYLSSGKMNNILIICAEMMSKHMDWNDRGTCVLFGDGASACVVTHGNALKYTNLTANGNSRMINISSGTGNSPFTENTDGKYLHMEGQEVFKFAVNIVESELDKALSTLGISAEKIDHFLLHQANKRIIDSIKNKLRQPEEKFPVNIDRYGNLSSASLPLLLFEMLENGEIKPGDTLFLSAFGAGMTAGGCVIVWE